MTPSGTARLFAGYLATGVVVVVSLVAEPPLPLALALAAGATVLLAQGFLGFGPGSAERSRHPVEALIHEVERSRRYGRRCTLARVAGAGEASVETRRTDEAWDIGGDLMLLMPETTSASAQLAVERLVGEQAAGRLVMATFPDDALTVHGLLDAIRTPDPAPDATQPDEAPAPGEVNLGLEVG